MEMQEDLRRALNPLIKDNYIIEPWNTEDVLHRYKENIDENSFESNADEDVWFRFFSKQHDIAIVVADHDLSGYGHARISESAIADACRQSATPVCTYHRAPSKKTTGQSLRGIYGQTKSFTIALDMATGREQLVAKNIISLADGFANIQRGFELVEDEVKKQGPAAILAEILGKPGLANALALYASGPSLASDTIYHIAQNQGTKNSATHDLDARLPFILGCWLSNYILPFPGLILNEKATASYLNLATADFKQNSKHFESAKYQGPFSGYDNYWWRTDLEQLLIDSDSDDGLIFLKKKEIEASPSVCISTKESPAGYYCIVQKEPISLEASVGNLGWIPQGAHLSRIDQNIYDTVAHMMGI